MQAILSIVIVFVDPLCVKTHLINKSADVHNYFTCAFLVTRPVPFTTTIRTLIFPCDLALTLKFDLL